MFGTHIIIHKLDLRILFWNALIMWARAIHNILTMLRGKHCFILLPVKYLSSHMAKKKYNWLPIYWTYMLMEDTWTVLVKKIEGGFTTLSRVSLKKNQFLIFWNEVRHEAPHCTRWLLLRFIFHQCATRRGAVWRKGRVVTASDWWIFIAVVWGGDKCERGGPPLKRLLETRQFGFAEGRRVVEVASIFF